MTPLPDVRRDASTASAASAAGGHVDALTDGAGSQVDVASRLQDVRARIRRVAEDAGRSPHAVTLVAVSKRFELDAINAARASGQADFGESRAQELRDKSKALGPGVRWHFVGQMQRNKVRDLVGVASLIHSVDRLDLAEAIADRARREHRVQRVLVQVNVGEDPAKAGCQVDQAAGLIAKIRALGGIACEGLMTIPPLEADPRPLFAILRELRDDVRTRFPEVQHLSMGMSNDFEVAVSEGATIVRVGEAVFGPRQPGDAAAG